MKIKSGCDFGSRATRVWFVCLVAVCGIFRGSAAPAPGEVRWRMPLAGLSPQPPVVAPDGTIFLAASSSDHQLHPEQETTVLMALSSEGVERWRRTFAGAIQSLPVRMPDGDLVLTPFGRVVYRVQSDGSDRSTAATPFLLRGAAVTQGGDLVVLGEDRGTAPTQLGVQILDTQGRTHGSWTVSYGGNGDSAKLVPGVPPVVAADGALITLRADGGARWTSLADGVSQERVGIVGSVANRVAGAAPAALESVVMATPTGMASLDASLNTQWELAGTGFNAPPVIGAGGWIYFGDESGTFQALGPDGLVRWKQVVEGPIHGAAAVLANGDVAVSTQGGRTLAFDAAGKRRWSLGLGGTAVGGLMATPGGDILAALQEGELVCIAGGSPVASEGWPVIGGNPAHSGRSASAPSAPGTPTLTRALDQVDVLVSWKPAAAVRRYELWSAASQELQKAHRSVVSLDGSTHAWVTDSRPGVTNWFWLRGVNESGIGAFSDPLALMPALDLWRIAVRGGLSAPTSAAMPLGPAWVRDQVIIAWTDATTPPTTRVQAYSESGVLQWERNVDGSFASAPVVDGQDRIVIVTSTGISVLKANGSLVGSSSGVIEGLGVPAVGQDGVIHVPTSVLSRLTYRIGSEGVTPILLTNAPLSSVLVAGMLEVGPSGGVAMGGPGGFWVLPPAGGLALWSNPSLPATAVAALPNGDWMVGTSFALHRVSADGNVRWSNSQVRVGAPLDDRWRDSLAVDGDGTTYCVGLNEIFAVGAEGTLKWRHDLAGAGIGIGAPMLDETHHLLVPTNDGLLRLDREQGTSDLAPLHFRHGAATTPLLAASGRMFWFDGVELRAIAVGAGADASAPWPLPGRDVHRSSSLARPSGPPPAPTQVKSEPWLGFNRVQWSVGELVDRVVYRSDSPDFLTAKVVGIVGPGAGAFDDPTALAGQSQYYWVVARNAVGESISVSSGSVVTATGSVRARIPLHFAGNLATPITLTRDGRVLLGTSDAVLHQWTLDLTNAWSLQVDPFVPELHGDFRGPIVADVQGRLWVATESGVHPVSTAGVQGPIVPGWNVAPLLLRDGTLVNLRPNDRLLARSTEGTGSLEVVLPESGSILPASDVNTTVYRLTASGRLQAIAHDGRIRWSRPLAGSTPTGLAIDVEGHLILAGSGGALQALSGADGTQVWSANLGGQELSSPVLGPDAVFVLVQGVRVPGKAAAGFWTCVDLATGKIRWQREAGIVPTAAAAVAADGTVYLPQGPRLYAVDAATGATRWVVELDGTSLTPPLIHSDGTVVVATSFELVSLNAGSGPALSGWPMVRGDAANTGSQGGGGALALQLTPDPVGGGWWVEPSASTTPFFLLTSPDLKSWAPPLGAKLTHRVRVASSNSAFFQGFAP